MNAIATVKKLKDNDQDFEWYPTTNEIIENVKKYLGKDHNGSVLDTGAGDGKVLAALTSGTKYAIEKSKILIDMLDKDIFVIGTDFLQQTLIDKEVDVIFCNPPYSQYELWMNKIISEANAKRIFLVVPERWENSDEIKATIKKRDAHVHTIGNFDFCNAERQARCKVAVIDVSLADTSYSYDSHHLRTDPFKVWFDNNFKINADKTECKFEKAETKKQRLTELVDRKNLVDQLAKHYNIDMEKLMGTYKSLENLDSDILNELGVSLEGVIEGLALKIKGLKNLYWGELFSNLDVITNRLTSKSREKLLRTLTKNTSVDFTVENAYSVIIWAIKNANEYLDDQLKEIYMTLSDQKNVKFYKSNHRIIEDGWRYHKSDMTHYRLDYRIVHDFYNCFPEYDFEKRNGLAITALDLIGDIFTIASNLGFDVDERPDSYHWEPGEKHEFKCNGKLFCDIKAFKNGNIHFRFCQNFMKSLNIEAARLNGWIKNPKEAVTEFDVTEKEASAFFSTNFQITCNSIKLLEVS